MCRCRGRRQAHPWHGTEGAMASAGSPVPVRQQAWRDGAEPPSSSAGALPQQMPYADAGAEMAAGGAPWCHGVEEPPLPWRTGAAARPRPAPWRPVRPLSREQREALSQLAFSRWSTCTANNSRDGMAGCTAEASPCIQSSAGPVISSPAHVRLRLFPSR